MLVAFFESQGFSPSDAATDAGTALNLISQNYTLAEIATVIMNYHQTRANLAANQVAQATAAIATTNAKVAANAAVSATSGASSTPMPPVTAPQVTSIAVLNSPQSGFWNVTLGYSDGSSVGYELSTANVNSWIAKGAALVDNSNGAWAAANGKTTTQSNVSVAPAPATGQNVSVGVLFYTKSGTLDNQYTLSNQVLTATDYNNLNSSVKASYGSRVVLSNATPTNSPVTINASALSEQIDISISLIDNAPIVNPTTTGGTLNGQNITQPVQFNIILPSGQSKQNVVLSASDYLSLQQNVGIFTITNATQGSFTPNTTYSALLTWLGSAPTISAPATNILSSNSATSTQPSKTNVVAAAAKTATKITILNQADANDWNVTLLYNDGTQQSYTLSTANVNFWISQGATLNDQTNGKWAAANGTTPAPATPSGNPTSITISSQSSTGFWNVILAYGNGTSQNQNLSTVQVNSYISQGVPMFDQTKGAWSATSNALSNSESNTKTPPAASATVTNVIILSKVDSSDWRVTLTYSDKSVNNYTLSTANIQSYLNAGATLNDQTNGAWVAATNPIASAGQSIITTIQNLLGLGGSAASQAGQAVQSAAETAATAAENAASQAAAAVAAIPNEVTQAGTSAAAAVTAAETQAENSLSTVASTAETNIAAMVAKLTGNPPSSQPTQPTQAPTPTTPAPTAVTLASITILNQADANDWNVTLGYSDGTEKSLTLSTANIQADLAAGASLIDSQGLFLKAATSATNNLISQTFLQIAVSKLKQYSLPIILGLSAAAGIGMAYSSVRKHEGVQRVR